MKKLFKILVILLLLLLGGRSYSLNGMSEGKSKNFRETTLIELQFESVGIERYRSFCRRIKIPDIIWAIKGYQDEEIVFSQETLNHIQRKHPNVPIWYIQSTIREPELLTRLGNNWKYYKKLLDSNKYLCVILWIRSGYGRVKTAYIVEKPK